MRKEAGIEVLREKPRYDGDRTISVAPMMDCTDGYGFDRDIKRLGFRDSALKDRRHPGVQNGREVALRGKAHQDRGRQPPNLFYNPGLIGRGVNSRVGHGG